MRAVALILTTVASQATAGDAVIVFSTPDEVLELSPSDVANAHTTFDNNAPGISFVLAGPASTAFANLTERSIGKTLTMSVCGEVLISATIQSRLEGRGNAPVDGLGLAEFYTRRMTGEEPCS